MEDLLDNIKNKSSKPISNKIKKDVEKDINIMNYKLKRIIQNSHQNSNLSENYLSEQYLESIKKGKSSLDGKEKINKIDDKSYGANWYKLSLETREEKLLEYFDDLDDILFENKENKESIISNVLILLHENKLNTSKEVKYDRVNQRIIKLMNLKLNLETKKFIWVETIIKKERPKWMKKMLKKR